MAVGKSINIQRKDKQRKNEHVLFYLRLYLLLALYLSYCTKKARGHTWGKCVLLNKLKRQQKVPQP